MIIVGAGPSLAKNIEHLRSAQDKAIIVCVARALHSLQSAGIVPDFAISLDAIDVRSHFRDIRISEIPGLLLSMTSHPNLFELKHPGIITFSANTEAEGWMVDAEDELVETPTGGSVSCAAMSIGLLWRCDPIIMVGQDLAFEDGAVYHHGGTDGATRVRHDPTTNTWTYTGFSRDLAHSLKDQMVGGVLKAHATAVPGYFGGSVPTTPEFAAVRQWFGFTAQDEAGRTTLYNCTEGGAYVDGMRHVPLSDVLEPTAATDPDTTRGRNTLTLGPCLQVGRLVSQAVHSAAAPPSPKPLDWPRRAWCRSMRCRVDREPWRSSKHLSSNSPPRSKTPSSLASLPRRTFERPWRLALRQKTSRPPSRHHGVSTL